MRGRPLLERFAVGAAFEQSWFEGASASGITGHACVRFGRACIGARARYAREPDRAVNLTAMSRTHGTVLATASTTLSLGRMTLAPEVGAGIGWTSTRRLDTCIPDNNMGGTPPDPNCEMNRWIRRVR